jgi:hypothetical protein
MEKLSREQLSYIIGFLHSDGHLYETTRNRGKISIELNIRDMDILLKLQSLIGGKLRKRKRTTNFGYIHSCILEVHSLETRSKLKKSGLIVGSKCERVFIPEKLSVRHYLRGFVDGDGSIGFTGNEEPFISIVTKSETLKNQILDLFQRRFHTIKKLSRNKRDNIYNIIIKNENALKFGKLLYYKSSLYLNRKYKSYTKISKWIRTKNIGNKH